MLLLPLLLFSLSLLSQVVHVYNVVSHARRFYRTLVFSSDAALCLYDMPCTLFLEGTRPRLIAGDPRKAEPRSSSLLITRNLTTALGQQARRDFDQRLAPGECMTTVRSCA